MALGLGVLQLPSSQFWAMTPREFNAAADAIFGRPAERRPIARDGLAALMTRYPDTNR